MADRKTPSAPAETTEAQIAVHWKEEEYYDPPAGFIAQANLQDPSVNERFAEKNFPKCFEEYADMLTWSKRWETVLDTSKPPFWKWFVGGKINASFNCVDRHLPKYKNKAAIISVPELEEESPVTVTYQELYVRINEFAALLRDFAGLKAGDRVTIHMPMLAELPITMLACARLGVIHSVASAPPTPAAACSSTWTATTETENGSTTRRPQSSRSRRRRRKARRSTRFSCGDGTPASTVPTRRW